MPRAKPITDFTTQPDITIPAADAAIIARALHEAADRHLNGWNADLHEDADVGRTMMAVLRTKYPDALQAFDRAVILKEAIAAGFLPPGRGDLVMAAKVYLAEYHGAQKAAREVHRPPAQAVHSDCDLGDPDFPF